MAQAYWHIRNCSLFQLLNDAQVRTLEEKARVRRFEKGQTIYRPSDAADGTYLLAEGRVRICSLTPDARESILGFVEPGEIFGELGLAVDGYREERAVAAVDSVVTYIPNDVILNLMDESKQLALGVTKMLGARRKRIERRLRNLLFRTNKDRLKGLLVELAEQYGAPTAEGVELTIRLSHQDLAAIIGATRETVTTLLGEMQENGVLVIRRQRLIIHDVRALADSVRPADWVEPQPREPKFSEAFIK